MIEDLSRDPRPEALIHLTENSAHSVAGGRREPIGGHSALLGRTARREERSHLPDYIFAVEEFAPVRLPDSLCKRIAKPGNVGFSSFVLLDQESQRFTHDLALIVVEPGLDLVLDEFLELWSEIDVHGRMILLLSIIIKV
jgi:hypothetical protein